jgi:preprotein translocase subunit YajC
MGPLVFAAVTFALLWVLFILPQQRRLRAHQGIVRRLEIGDEVVTTSGLFGTIVDLDDEVVQLEVAPGTVVRVARVVIGRRLVEEVDAAAPPSAPAAEAAAVDADADDPAASEN